jgi:hypothetical protein
LILPIKSTKNDLKEAIKGTLQFFKDNEVINSEEYARGSYSPTPTIIEAAVSLYNNHSVDAITRNDAEAKNLKQTTTALSELIDSAKANSKKVSCDFSFRQRERTLERLSIGQCSISCNSSRSFGQR